MGLSVHFTLATYPGETFEGQVSQVRLNAQSTQNVRHLHSGVTTDNPATAEYPYGKLFPGMTADLKFEVGTSPQRVVVPNAALRWKPQPAQIAPDQRRTARGRHADYGERQRGLRRQTFRCPGGRRRRGQATAGRSQARLGERRRLRPPAEGPCRQSDGSMTEISGDGLKEGNGGGDRREPQRGFRRRWRRYQEPVSPQIRPGGAPKAKQ